MLDPSAFELGWRNCLEVAAKAQLDIKTVRRWLAGKPVQPASLIRIERALRTMGFVDTEKAP